MIGRQLSILAVVSGLIYFALLQYLALSATGGVFEYPLDDVYIHLAMAESIARGEYGVNPGEYSSASSSALYPLLLLPIGPPEVQRLLPLFWNVVGLAATAWLWGRVLEEGGYSETPLKFLGYALAVLGPIALNMTGIAALGMEHTLHAAATLAIFLGLLLFLKGTPNWPLLFAGLFLAPLFRFEGLAFTLLAATVLLTEGQRLRAGVAVAVAVLPIASFCLFLLSLGLDPLPNSISAKLAAGTETEGTGTLERLIANAVDNIIMHDVSSFLLAAIVCLLIAVQRFPVATAPYRPLLLAGALALLAHLLFGRIGWAGRYEHYVVILGVSAVIFALGHARASVPRPVIGVFAAAFLVVPASFYVAWAFRAVPASAVAMRSQPYLMQRVAKEVLNEPVAVNDIGWMTWGNPNYVVDLWGLASAEALEMWESNAPRGWADPIVARRGARLAMVYDRFFEGVAGDDWVRLGQLTLRIDQGYLADHEVSFYATDPAFADQLRTLLEPWAEGLPATVEFRFEETPS